MAKRCNKRSRSPCNVCVLHPSSLHYHEHTASLACTLFLQTMLAMASLESPPYFQAGAQPHASLQVEASVTVAHEHVSHQLFPLLPLQITLAMASLIFYLAWWMFYVWRAQKSLKQKLYSEHKMGHMHINLMVIWS